MGRIYDIIPHDFIQKLDKTFKNKYSIINYDIERKLYKIDFNDETKDIIYILKKLKPLAYYTHSKHKLEKSNFDTTVFFCWPETFPSRIDNLYRFIDEPIFTGIRIKFNQSERFLSAYEKALDDLIKNENRESQPTNYKIYPLISFENIHPAQYLDFNNFVEYNEDYWYGLKEHINNYITYEEIDERQEAARLVGERQDVSLSEEIPRNSVRIENLYITSSFYDEEDRNLTRVINYRFADQNVYDFTEDIFERFWEENNIFLKREDIKQHILIMELKELKGLGR